MLTLSIGCTTQERGHRGYARPYRLQPASCLSSIVSVPGHSPWSALGRTYILAIIAVVSSVHQRSCLGGLRHLSTKKIQFLPGQHVFEKTVQACSPRRTGEVFTIVNNRAEVPVKVSFKQYIFDALPAPSYAWKAIQLGPSTRLLLPIHHKPSEHTKP